MRFSPRRAFDPSTPDGYRSGAIATLSAVLVYLLATATEIVIIRVLRPTEIELTWISDAFLAGAFGVAVFLWLHLKSTRMTLSRLEREHIVLDAQLAFAAEIQRGLLPPLPANDEGLRWGARLVQAGRIGGDLYDFVRAGPGSWMVLVGDVSGKGVPAALVLSSIRTMFRMMTPRITDPGELVARISDRLYADHGGVPYFTCIVLRVDVERQEVVYVNAGHPSALVLDRANPARDAIRLASCAPPAGLFPHQTFQTISLAVPAGAVTILVTDGITEALDFLGFGGDSLPLPANVPGSLEPTQICEGLIERTAPALASGEWQDDRTVVAFALER